MKCSNVLNHCKLCLAWNCSFLYERPTWPRKTPTVKCLTTARLCIRANVLWDSAPKESIANRDTFHNGTHHNKLNWQCFIFGSSKHLHRTRMEEQRLFLTSCSWRIQDFGHGEAQQSFDPRGAWAQNLLKIGGFPLKLPEKILGARRAQAPRAPQWLHHPFWWAAGLRKTHNTSSKEEGKCDIYFFQQGRVVRAAGKTSPGSHSSLTSRDCDFRLHSNIFPCAYSFMIWIQQSIINWCIFCLLN